MAIPRGYEFTPASTRHPTIRRSRRAGDRGRADRSPPAWRRRSPPGHGSPSSSRAQCRRSSSGGRFLRCCWCSSPPPDVVRSDAAWTDLEPDRLGPFTGWAAVVTDPQPFGGAARVILEIDGERHEAWVRGRVRRLRVESWQAGDVVAVAGERRPLDADRRGRVSRGSTWSARSRSTGSATRAPADASRPASNRVRSVIERGLASLPQERAALARGLMIGDDRDQSAAAIERMRTSGLAAPERGVRTERRPRHRRRVATAAQGATAGPLVGDAGVDRLVRRADPRRAVGAASRARWPRSGRRPSPSAGSASRCACWPSPSSVCCWSTRCSPGRSGSGSRSGATAGVTGVGPPLAARLDRLGPLAMPVAVTLGAQVGVAVPSVVVFGRLPARRPRRQPAGSAGRRPGDALRPPGVPGGRRDPGARPTARRRRSDGACGGSTPSPPSGAAAEPAAPWSWVGWGPSARVRRAVGSSLSEARLTPRCPCTS